VSRHPKFRLSAVSKNEDALTSRATRSLSLNRRIILKLTRRRACTADNLTDNVIVAGHVSLPG
jgi:hypothetical protein